TLVGVLWVGVTVPSLSPLHGSRAGADRSVAIALESALLGIDDASSRALRASTLADRLGVVPSGRLLPTPESLRAAAAELSARASGGIAPEGGALTIALREPLFVPSPAIDPAPSGGGGAGPETLAYTTAPAPAPPPERAPAPTPATAPPTSGRGSSSGGSARAGAGTPPVPGAGAPGVPAGGEAFAGG